MIKLFADECINSSLVFALKKSGFDVLTVREAGLSGSSDEIIYNFAQTKQRVLLTFDRGFGDIFRFNIAESHGVIVILANQMERDKIANIVIKFLNRFKRKGLRGKLVVIGRNKIRISGQ